jgi:hypothetical protein
MKFIPPQAAVFLWLQMRRVGRRNDLPQSFSVEGEELGSNLLYLCMRAFFSLTPFNSRRCDQTNAYAR